jgi:hypothetical protein
MSFWNVDNPLKPWGLFDPNATLDIPFDWSAWLAEIGAAHASHEIIVPVQLQVVGSSEAAGIVTAFIKVAVGQTITLNQKYPVTCRITTTGATPRVDDRTVYLKMVER